MATIRFEDLGKPIQKLLLGLKSGYTDEDMSLMAYIHVKDMVKVFDDLNSQKAAEKIWKELKKQLIKRQEEEKAAERLEEDHLLKTAEQIAERETQIQKEREAEEEAERKKQKKAEKRRKKKEEAAAAAAAAAEEEAAEEPEVQDEEAEVAEDEAVLEERRRLKEEKRLAKQKKREEREAALRAEEERLAEEEAAEEARLQEEKAARKAERKRLKEEAARLRQDEEEIRQRREKAKALKAAKPNLKKEWETHVKNHPLEFADDDGETHIVQEKIQISSKKPPSQFLKVKAVAVPSVVEEEETAFYTCDVHLHSGKTTSVRRRYNQFYELRNSLGGTLDALEVGFPGKTLWKVKGPALDKRRLELEMWVNDVISKLSTTRSYAGVQLDAKQQLRGDAARAEAEKQRMRQAAIARAALHNFCGIEGGEEQ